MTSCEDCHWADFGEFQGVFDCPIDCQKDEPQEWIRGEVFPVTMPCASFVNPEEIEVKHAPQTTQTRGQDTDSA